MCDIRTIQKNDQPLKSSTLKRWETPLKLYDFNKKELTKCFFRLGV